MYVNKSGDISVVVTTKDTSKMFDRIKYHFRLIHRIRATRLGGEVMFEIVSKGNWAREHLYKLLRGV